MIRGFPQAPWCAIFYSGGEAKFSSRLFGLDGQSPPSRIAAFWYRGDPVASHRESNNRRCCEHLANRTIHASCRLWCQYLLPAATRWTSTPTSSPWSRHWRRTSGNGWIRSVSTSTIRGAGHGTGSRQASSQLRMASGRSSRLSERSSMTISVIRNRKAWLPTESHAGARQSDSCRGRTSLEESIVESARRSTGGGKRAMSWTQSDSGPLNTRLYALKPVMRLRYQAEL
jgi:hypothetical protein